MTLLEVSLVIVLGAWFEISFDPDRYSRCQYGQYDCGNANIANTTETKRPIIVDIANFDT